MPIFLTVLISILSIFFVTFENIGQLDSPKIDQVSFYFKDGSSKELSKFFENGIELNINGNQRSYSRIQAELVMREFFQKFPPADFKIIHQGGNFDQILYFIGNYSSENFLFRVLIKSKSINEELKIFGIDIIRD